jgi:hypothetical protein
MLYFTYRHDIAELAWKNNHSLYFTCSPEHKAFLFFTGLNNKDKIPLRQQDYKQSVHI